MSCNDSLPISDIVAAVAEQLSKQYVAKEDGVAKNLTLKGDVTLDRAAVASLCEALEDCIDNAITDALPPSGVVAKDGGIANNLTLKGDVTLDRAAVASLCEALETCIKDLIASEAATIKSFELVGEQLRITMSNGNTVSADLSQFTTAAEATKIADDIKKQIVDVHLVSAELFGDILLMTMSDGKQLKVPLTGLGDDVHLASGTVQGNNLVLTKNDGTKVTINLEQFANVAPTAGNIALANDEKTVLGKFLA